MSITPDLKVEVLISHSYLAIVKSEHARGLMLAERALELSPRYIPALIVKGGYNNVARGGGQNLSLYKQRGRAEVASRVFHFTNLLKTEH